MLVMGSKVPANAVAVAWYAVRDLKSVTDTSTAFLVGDHRESRSSIQLLNQIYRAGLPGIAQTSMGKTRPGKRKDRIVEELKTDNGRLE
jgi:hypothetical protein